MFVSQFEVHLKYVHVLYVVCSGIKWWWQWGGSCDAEGWRPGNGVQTQVNDTAVVTASCVFWHRECSGTQGDHSARWPLATTSGFACCLACLGKWGICYHSFVRVADGECFVEGVFMQEAVFIMGVRKFIVELHCCLHLAALWEAPAVGSQVLFSCALCLIVTSCCLLLCYCVTTSGHLPSTTAWKVAKQELTAWETCHV